MSVPFHISTRSVQGTIQTGGGEATGFTFVNMSPVSSSPAQPAMQWVITCISCSVQAAGQSELYVTTFDGNPSGRRPLYDMFADTNLVQAFDPPLVAPYGFAGFMVRHIVVDDPPPAGGFSTTLNVCGYIEGTLDKTIASNSVTFRDFDAPEPPGGWLPNDWPGNMEIG